jgi:hypothetical protein
MDIDKTGHHHFTLGIDNRPGAGITQLADSSDLSVPQSDIRPVTGLAGTVCYVSIQDKYVEHGDHPLLHIFFLFGISDLYFFRDTWNSGK